MFSYCDGRNSNARLRSAGTNDAGNASRGDAMGDDIIVTARKREERAQDIRIAISAFSCDAIAARPRKWRVAVKWKL